MVNVIEVKRKICLIGDWRVGKTSLVKRFVLDQFDDDYLATFGIKVIKKRIKYDINDDKIIDLNLQIWDVMGQEDFKKAQMMAYRGARGAFIICDVTRRETLASVDRWQAEIYDITGEIPIIIIANKYDLKDQITFDVPDLEVVSKNLHSPYFLTSAKTGENVNNAFRKLGNEIIKDYS